MIQKAGFCCFKPDPITPQKAEEYLGLYIPNYPKEKFAYINTEDVVKNKYFITSYGRVFDICGKELFPEIFTSPENNVIYTRIELSCTTYYKRRKFFVHRLVADAFIPKTADDIANNRNIVNHKYNRDGRCNYVWNLEWSNISENTLHGIGPESIYDQNIYNIDHIIKRRSLIDYDSSGDKNPKSRISEFQAHLIRIAYTKLHYNSRDCAIYAWLEGNTQDILLVSSIIHGHAWKHVGIQYGIEPDKKGKHSSYYTRVREDKKDEYNSIASKRNYS